MTHKLLQFTAFPLERLSPQRLFVLMGMIYQGLRAGKMWGEGIVLGDCEAAGSRRWQLESFWDWGGLSKTGGRAVKVAGKEGKDKTNY